jgi:hypothetical protein
MPIINRATATAVATDTAAAEKAILTFTANQDAATGSSPIVIDGMLNVTPGTSTTAVVVKVRQGSGTSGTQVGSSITTTLAAAANGNVPFMFEDSAPAANAGSVYSVTITQTAGAAAGTVNYVYAKANAIGSVSAS